MENWIKWILSIVGGALEAFFQQYGLFIVLVAVAVVLDVITGLVKAKATGEGAEFQTSNTRLLEKGITVCRSVVWDFLGLCSIDRVC